MQTNHRGVEWYVGERGSGGEGMGLVREFCWTWLMAAFCVVISKQIVDLCIFPHAHKYPAWDTCTKCIHRSDVKSAVAVLENVP